MIRIEKLREFMAQRGLDSLFLLKPENRRYATGFTGTTGLVLLTRQRAMFFTDFRYMAQAKKQCVGYEILEVSREMSFLDYMRTMRLGKMGFENTEMDVATYTHMRDSLPNTEFIALGNGLLEVRAVKDQNEIENIKKAASIADEAFEHILNFISPGMKENEVALELEIFMRRKGASALSFESIVASGLRSALPHGVATDKVIEHGDIVTMDYGCVYNGYCSDMTRTVIIGKANEKQKKIYNIVLEAQQRVIGKIFPGKTGQDLDLIARNYIDRRGYGSYFGHGLGHGVGLQIHELPNISVLGKEPLVSGMIITDEPGIYIPDFGGVRIEDLILVTDSGCEVLSKSTKDLIEI